MGITNTQNKKYTFHGRGNFNSSYDKIIQFCMQAGLTLKFSSLKHYQMPLRQEGIWPDYIVSCMQDYIKEMPNL